MERGTIYKLPDPVTGEEMEYWFTDQGEQILVGSEEEARLLSGGAVDVLIEGPGSDSTKEDVVSSGSSIPVKAKRCRKPKAETTVAKAVSVRLSKELYDYLSRMVTTLKLLGEEVTVQSLIEVSCKRYIKERLKKDSLLRNINDIIEKQIDEKG